MQSACCECVVVPLQRVALLSSITPELLVGHITRWPEHDVDFTATRVPTLPARLSEVLRRETHAIEELLAVLVQWSRGNRIAPRPEALPQIASCVASCRAERIHLGLRGDVIHKAQHVIKIRGQPLIGDRYQQW